MSTAAVMTRNGEDLEAAQRLLATQGGPTAPQVAQAQTLAVIVVGRSLTELLRLLAGGIVTHDGGPV